jgi:hypothetical protein
MEAGGCNTSIRVQAVFNGVASDEPLTFAKPPQSTTELGFASAPACFDENHGGLFLQDLTAMPKNRPDKREQSRRHKAERADPLLFEQDAKYIVMR